MRCICSRAGWGNRILFAGRDHRRTLTTRLSPAPVTVDLPDDQRDLHVTRLCHRHGVPAVAGR